MADDGSRRRGRATSLLGTAAPALLVGGLFLVVGDRDPAPVVPDSSPTTSPAVVQDDRSRSSATTGTVAVRERGVVPRLVVVPSLGVRAPVTGIRTEDGALTPPSDPTTVGWWNGGSRPGAGTGAAVITGHTVHPGGGAFDDLDRLAAGDEVVVESKVGRLTYTVESVQVLGKDQLARRSGQLFSRSGAPRLVLVTCEDWDGTGYRSNVVVTATPRA